MSTDEETDDRYDLLESIAESASHNGTQHDDPYKRSQEYGIALNAERVRLEAVDRSQNMHDRFVMFVTTWVAAVALAIYCLALGPCCTSLHTTPTLDQRSEQTSRAVVLRSWCMDMRAAPITGVINIDDAGIGSGTIIDRHHVLTASHVVRCDNETSAPLVMLQVNESGIWSPVKVEHYYGPDIDAAVLVSAFDLGFDAITVGDTPRIDESVCAAMAFPKAHYDCGAYVEHYESMTGIDMEITIPVVPGNSGSGLFNRRGQLVGVVTAQRLCHKRIDTKLIKFPVAAPASDEIQHSYSVLSSTNGINIGGYEYTSGFNGPYMDVDGDWYLLIPIPEVSTYGGEDCNGLATSIGGVL